MIAAKTLIVKGESMKRGNRKMDVKIGNVLVKKDLLGRGNAVEKFSGDE